MAETLEPSVYLTGNLTIPIIKAVHDIMDRFASFRNVKVFVSDQFSDGKTGLAAWDYGDGRAYYFSDFDVASADEAVFRERMTNSINQTLIYLGTQPRAPFVLDDAYYNITNIDGKVIISGWS